MARVSKKGKKSKLTPMMQQYMGVKNQYPDAVIFFRMGDFFEMFFQDAILASEVLGITQTYRNKHDGDPIPMAGIPHHSYRNYVNKMVEAGHTVVICDQIEDAKLAKGLVKRDVTRIVTPGMALDPDDLDSRSNHYLVAAFFGKKISGIAHIDLTTGEFRVTELPGSELLAEALRIHPREVLVSEDQMNTPVVDAFTEGLKDVAIKPIDGSRFAKQETFDLLCEQFDVHSMDGFGVGHYTSGLRAAGAIISYVQETQKIKQIPHISKLAPYSLQEFMIVDEVTRANLELVESMRERTRKGSLFALMDKTQTAMGGRKLKQWILYPLLDKHAILERLDTVETFCDTHFVREGIREQLKQIKDIERLNSKVASQIATPRDLATLRFSLEVVPLLLETLEEVGEDAVHLQRLRHALMPLPEVTEDIARVLIDTPPNATKDGGLIREGFHTELDELRDIASHGKDRILELQAQEQEATGIQSLKIKFNRVFGYYLEVTKPNLHLVPEHYIRKQTMVNHERFITEDLKEFEEKILGAEERSLSLEQNLFIELRQRIAAFSGDISRLADAIAQLDVLSTFADQALQHDYCRPEITEEPVLHIESGRHPVVEQMMHAGDFVPNDLHLPVETTRFILLTGPNMSGKSTCMRQMALLALMAQVGSFVPASSATVGICDRIFTRVGASDNLAEGQSTFMVEMTETANILHNATDRSLVILDEIGRGTSTFDGLSIAWSVAEHLHNRVGCRTLFATHYHELTELEQSLSHFHNMSVSISEQDGELHFLHRLVDGGSNRSYGIQVAKLAGLPRTVVRRANKILKELEQGKLPNVGELGSKVDKQLSLFVPVSTLQEQQESAIEEELRQLNVDQLSPLDALKLIHEWKSDLLEADEKLPVEEEQTYSEGLRTE